MQENLELERVERDSATEFKGAVKTEKKGDARKSDDGDGKRVNECPKLDSQEADGEDEEFHDTVDPFQSSPDFP